MHGHFGDPPGGLGREALACGVDPHRDLAEALDIEQASIGGSRGETASNAHDAQGDREHVLLLQTPVLPSDPAPFTAPAYLLAGGALFGVLLTLGVQAIQARIQRRHDRQGRAFDARLESYADFLAALWISAEQAESLERLRSHPIFGELKNAQTLLAAASQTLQDSANGVAMAAGADGAGVRRWWGNRDRTATEQNGAKLDHQRAVAEHELLEQKALLVQARLDAAEKEYGEYRWREINTVKRLQILAGDEVFQLARKVALIGDRFSEEFKAAEQEIIAAGRRDLGV